MEWQERLDFGLTLFLIKEAGKEDNCTLLPTLHYYWLGVTDACLELGSANMGKPGWHDTRLAQQACGDMHFSGVRSIGLVLLLAHLPLTYGMAVDAD
jgi:hypothetical protein